MRKGYQVERKMKAKSWRITQIATKMKIKVQIIHNNESPIVATAT